MSYILDALKRAETQRQRAATPGLHSLHLTPEVQPAKQLSRSAAPWLLGVALAVGVLAAAFWVWLSTPDYPETPVTVQPVVAPAALAPAAVNPVATVATMPVTTPEQTSAPAKSEETPLPVAQARVVKTRPPVTSQSAPPTAIVKPVKPAKPVKSAKSTESDASSAMASVVVRQADLPATVRSALPKITITGSVYADAPGQRLLLVNNLVLTQGQTLAPDLVLEEIQQHSSVFNFHGTRFRVAH